MEPDETNTASYRGIVSLSFSSLFKDVENKGDVPVFEEEGIYDLDEDKYFY